jgi:hypothetical protein
MDNQHVTIVVSCLLLLGIAGTGAGAAPCAGIPDGAMLPPDTTAGPVTGDNSCPACLEDCNTRYPAAEHPFASGFCRFSCGVGSCRLPPVFTMNLPNP